MRVLLVVIVFVIGGTALRAQWRAEWERSAIWTLTLAGFAAILAVLISPWYFVSVACALLGFGGSRWMARTKVRR